MWDLDFFVFNGFDGEGAGLGWAYYTTDPETGDQLDSLIKNFETAKGDQIYFQPADGISGLTVAGEVADTKGATWTLPADAWIGTIVNPYPVATTFADLESFCVAGDTVYVFNPNVWDLDFYVYNGAGAGWAYYTTDPETGDQLDSLVEDPKAVILPAGIGGYFQPADSDGRVWKVTL